MIRRLSILSIRGVLSVSTLLAACLVVAGCSSSSSDDKDKNDSGATDAQAETNGAGGSAGSDAGDAASDSNGGQGDAQPQEGGDGDVQPQEGGDGDTEPQEGGDGDAEPQDGGEDVVQKSYGKIGTLKFNSTFAFDSSKLDPGSLFIEDPYIKEHITGAQIIPVAFAGVYDGDNKLPIPPAGSTSIAIALASRENLRVIQQSILGEGTRKKEVYPGVVLGFEVYPDKGEVTIDTTDGEGNLWLTIVEAGDAGERCVVAVGYGKVNVKAIADGLYTRPWSLQLEGADIELYPVANTPDGDVSSKIEGLTGMKACKSQIVPANPLDI